MITVDPPLDHSSQEAGTDKRLTTWYAQGHSDGLGDRLLMFDNTNAPSWEILRFKPAMAREPRFEAALRERVEQLASFQHDGFPAVRPIKRLGHDDGLAVVSTYSGGAALAEALKKPRSADFALRMIRQLVPALAALQRIAPGLAHGAITVDRIILSADGRLIIREHMVGAALDALEWPAARLWSEFGLLVPRQAGPVKIDERTDITQLALVILSLLAGRRIGPDEYPDKTGELLDELTLRHHWHNPTNPAKFQAVRYWLERALQLTGQSFTSAHDAQAALVDLQDHFEPSHEHHSAETSRAVPKEVAPKEVASQEDAPAPMWSSARGLPAPPPPAPAAEPPKPVRGRRRKPNLQSRILRRIAVVRERTVQIYRGIPSGFIQWAGVAALVLALVEAVVIARLLSTQSVQSPAATTTTVATPAPVPAPPPQIQAIEQAPAATTTKAPLVVATANVAPKLPEIRALQPPTPAVRTGGIRVSAPIELVVLEGERVLGSTTEGPIMAAAGRRELDFVNSAIGYRVRQTVEVKAGQITPFTVAVPNGVLNINALPWATVLIDGNSAGETPIGNLSVVPGEHEVILRHPQLGERRERVIVRSGVETRVSANLGK
jgi:hypothetical protein